MKKRLDKITTSLDRKRLLFLSLFIFALFSTLIAQYYQIQVVEGAKWNRLAERQHYFLVSEPFMRGIFISNNSIKKGHPEAALSFVIDVQKFHLFADPQSIPEEVRPPIVSNLTSILRLDQQKQEIINENLQKKSRKRKMLMWLSKDDQTAILNWWYPFAKAHKLPSNALFFVSDYQRSYPFGKLLGQVLHTIQSVKDEQTAEALPTGGLELYFNQYLKGRQGKRRLMRSPRRALETGEIITSPEHGANIYLTINQSLQAIAEEEIEKGVKKARAKSGWAIMLEPNTGEILALAQYPFFHPSDYQHYFNDKDLIQDTKVKAITDANEPGSIMKPITVAIALKANDELAKRGKPPIFNPHEMVATSNSYFPGRGKPLKDLTLHHYLNMPMAIQRSSNIYVARLAEKIVNQLGPKWYRNELLKLGFGRKTGIELPSESCGLLPTPGKLHPNGRLEWSGATPYSIAMGHNIQTTSLQSVCAIAAIANGGYQVKPTLIRKILKHNSDGQVEVVFDNTEEKPRRRLLSSEHAELVKTAMKYTTKNGGTGRRADIWGYSEAGKSGTGDKAINGVYDPRHVCSSFVGFTPASNPAFVLIVTIDEPEYGFVPGIGKLHLGGTCAAPVFKEIATRSLEYLGIPPDDPFGYPPGDPRHDPLRADWLPELKQLQEKYDKWNMR